MIRRASAHILRRPQRALVSSAATPPFNGNFASLFASPFVAWQSNLGATYLAATLAAGTSVVAGTLSGTLARPVPILFTCTTPGVIGSGAVFAASYDGGSTNAMTGITPTAGVPVPLTGAASGLSMSWAAGSAAADNTWTARCSGLADQSGNGFSASVLVAAPTFGVGVNGIASIDFNGSNQALWNSALTIPAPATTPFVIFTVFQQNAWQTNGPIVANGANAFLAQHTASPKIAMTLSSFGNDAPLALDTWAVGEAGCQNTMADYTRMGSAAAVTGASSGSASSASIRVAQTSVFSLNTQMKLLLLVIAPLQSTAAARAAVTATYGAGVLV